MVTQAQLNRTSEIILQLQEALGHLQEVVQFAVNAKIANVSLDATVINSLLTEYTNTKALLVTLFQQLP